MLYYLTLISLSGYLYFLNKIYMISCKIFFQLMATVFKENFNLQLTLVFETVFVSELIAENRFGALLATSDKFITKCF